MKERYIEVGQIVNTHGIRGEVRIVPWCDSAEFLSGFDTFYIEGKPVKVLCSRVHKTNLLALLEGCGDVNQAMRLKNKVVSIDREDANLPEGSHFIADLIGLRVVDADTGQELGRLDEVMSLPANDVYVVRGAQEYLIPAVSEFIARMDVDAGYMAVNMQRGLAVDED